MPICLSWRGQGGAICLSWYILFIMYMKYTGRVGYNTCGAVQTKNVPLGQKNKKTDISFLSQSFLGYVMVFIISYLMLHSLTYRILTGCMHTSQAPWVLSHEWHSECMPISEPPRPMPWTLPGMATVCMGKEFPGRQGGSKG